MSGGVACCVQALRSSVCAPAPGAAAIGAAQRAVGGQQLGGNPPWNSCCSGEAPNAARPPGPLGAYPLTQRRAMRGAAPKALCAPRASAAAAAGAARDSDGSMARLRVIGRWLAAKGESRLPEIAFERPGGHWAGCR